MGIIFVPPAVSLVNPTTDQVLADCIHIDSVSEARKYREAYLEWHKNRSQLRKPSNDFSNCLVETNWNYISAKITRANLLSHIKKNVHDKQRRDRLIELFDLETKPVKPIHFESRISAA